MSQLKINHFHEDTSWYITPDETKRLLNGHVSIINLLVLLIRQMYRQFETEFMDQYFTESLPTTHNTVDSRPTPCSRRHEPKGVEITTDSNLDIRNLWWSFPPSQMESHTRKVSVWI